MTRSNRVSPDGFYTVEARYLRDGAFVEQVLAVPGERVPAVKRAIRKGAIRGCRLSFEISPSEILRDEGSNGDPWYVCVCGNNPQDDGYFACDGRGELQSTLDGSPLSEWSGTHLTCACCGRYFALSNLVVLGRKLILAAATMLAIRITEVPNWSVQIGKETCGLLDFLCNNESEPKLLAHLRASLDGKPFRLGIGGGWSEEIKLIAPKQK